jgi:TonB family protein
VKMRTAISRPLLWTITALILAGLFLSRGAAFAGDARKVKNSPPPEYPDLARRFNLHGTARVEVVILPDGTVKDVKALGGNPVLVEALVRAVRKWKYEPSDRTSVMEVKYDFIGK